MSNKSPNSQDYRVLREAIEVLAGKRGNKRKAALTVGDANDLREFIAALRKGTADVQLELNGMVDSVAATQVALAGITTDLTSTQQAIEAANNLLASLQDAIASANSAIANANTAIDGLSTNASDVAARLDEIEGAATNITVTALTSPSTPLTVAPTAEDYNQLREDVRVLRQIAISLRNALR